MDADEFEELRRLAADARRDADREAGAVEEARKRLAEHGVRTTKEGRELLRRLEKETARLESEFGKSKASFERKWAQYPSIFGAT